MDLWPSNARTISMSAYDWYRQHCPDSKEFWAGYTNHRNSQDSLIIETNKYTLESFHARAAIQTNEQTFVGDGQWYGERRWVISCSPSIHFSSMKSKNNGIFRSQKKKWCQSLNIHLLENVSCLNFSSLIEYKLKSVNPITKNAATIERALRKERKIENSNYRNLIARFSLVVFPQLISDL